MAEARSNHIDADTLMRKLRDGELERAGDLFVMYNKRLYNFFLKLTFDRDLSLDLTQTVFYRMIRYRKSFKGNNPFRSWIYQIARNVMTDHFGKEIKRSDFADIEDIGNKADRSGQQEERYSQLYRAMTRLKPDQREVLVLSRFQNMKYREIAKIMNTTETNIKTKVHRAMKQLAQHYKKIESI